MTPEELMLGGCRLAGSRLTIRPTMPARLLSAWMMLLAVGLLAAAVFVPQPFLALPASATLLLAWRAYRAKVVATTEQLLIANRWKTRRFRWPDVSVIQAENDERSWRFPYSGPTQLAWKPKLCVGVVISGAERVECDALLSTRRSEGWGFGGAVPAEAKVAVLERWRQAVTVR